MSWKIFSNSHSPEHIRQHSWPDKVMVRLFLEVVQGLCCLTERQLVLFVLAFIPLSAWTAAPLPDPCNDVSKLREYRVSAIDVKMVLNRFGDRDEDAFMYVLDKNINAVKEWQALKGCTSWNKPGEPEKHIPCVSSGLRDDQVQPLVLRANLGQCLVIHFTNRLDPNKKPEIERRLFPRPNDGKASIQINGLAHSAENAGGRVGRNLDSFAATGETVTYKISMPSDPSAERAYYFHDGGGNRQRVPHGLFGVIVAEPPGSSYLDPQTGKPSDGTGWEAIIEVPDKKGFREFVLIYHEIGDEDFSNIIDGTLDNNQHLAQITLPSSPAGRIYRQSGRAINYRSEPFTHRLSIQGNIQDSGKFPFDQKKALGYSSYTFGDPATPIPRSYLGEATKTRLVHGGSEVFHVHHLHGGANRWRRNPKSDPNNDISSGLNKRPNQKVFSTHLDSQSIGPGTSYNLEHECGAGGCQQAAGDFLYHCHIGQHYLAGMWSLWRVFDTLQQDLAKLPWLTSPPRAVDSTQLVGKTFAGKTLVLDSDSGNPNTISLKQWVESQLPPSGEPLDDEDATVWKWTVEDKNGLPLYMAEPETSASWANYTPENPGERSVIGFNPTNGRYSWPLFSPHLGQRPPFAGNGHSGAPWLGEKGSKERSDGLCPDPELWGIQDQTIRQYPISAVMIDVPINDNEIDKEGMLFVLNEDIRGESPEGKVILTKSYKIEPLAIRSNVGDCISVILTSKLLDKQRQNNKLLKSRVNMHTHFVQFDPQASDGVITGFSYEQSVRPYRSERLLDDAAPSNPDQEPRQLVAGTAVDADEIVVNQIFRLRDKNGRPKLGVWIGIGLGEGVYDTENICCSVKVDKITPRTEIRRIADITANMGNGTFRIKLDRPLKLPHFAGEAVGVEFVRYNWYSDVDTGTVFWHDHVDFNSWDHGLFGAHVIEPEGSSWHDPKQGKPVRSGTVVDIHAPMDTSIGAGQAGSFREFVLFNHKLQSDPDHFGFRKATINLKAEPIADPRSPEGKPEETGRKGIPAHWFSSVTHGDPATPLPRAYVGDPFMIRHLGVMDRVGGVRITGHRFRIERFAPEAGLSDGSPIGISERYDLVMDGGAGGPLGMPGDFLYYSTVGRDMLGGAWGLVRVHDTLQEDLQLLPGRPQPPRGSGFPSQVAAAGDNSGGKPELTEDSGNPCPDGATEIAYNVHIRETKILLQSNLGQIMSNPELTIQEGVAFTLAGDPPDFVLEPLVLRVNHRECLVVNLQNDLPLDQLNSGNNRVGMHIGELLFDSQGSHGSAIGLNLDSTIAPGQSRTYRYFADKELGTTIAFNLANPLFAGRGAFAAVIVEPEDSVYQFPNKGELPSRIIADISGPKGNFREFVSLFHDSDPSLGHNDMPYGWEAHCRPVQGSIDDNIGDCEKDKFPVGSFTSISYSLNPWTLREDQQAPSDVFSSQVLRDPPLVDGDPRWVVQGKPGSPLMLRVAAPWAEQVHVFSLTGHRWPLEPGMQASEQVFARMLPPGYSFDAPVIGGFGGPYQKTGDFLFLDARAPFTAAGLWGLIRVDSEEDFDEE